MRTKILIAGAGIVIVFLMVVAMQPGDFRVARSATIPVPTAVVFERVNDLHQFQVWSPWAKLDPAVKNIYEGPSAGKGAALIWSGNGEVGAGRMTIVESRSNELIRMRLEFTEPLASTADVVFAFNPKGKATKVTWSMSGRNNFIGRAVCLFMDMDKMVGGQFEQGLANLSAVTATPSAR